MGRANVLARDNVSDYLVELQESRPVGGDATYFSLLFAVKAYRGGNSIAHSGDERCAAKSLVRTEVLFRRC